MRHKIGLIAATTLLAVMVATTTVTEAQAYSHSSLRTYSVQCHEYKVTFSRGGVFHIADLWTIKARVNWCQIPTGGTVWSGPTTHRNHDEGPTYQWGGWERKTITKKLHPTRWIIFTQAKEVGISGWPLVFYDHPTIKMTIWKNNPTHAVYEVHCNC